MDKPKWWPENPYPESVFPMKRERYAEIVPDPELRTGLSGVLGRIFWEIASDTIWAAVQDNLQAENEQLREVLEIAYEAYKDKCTGEKHTIKQIARVHRLCKEALKQGKKGK